MRAEEADQDRAGVLKRLELSAVSHPPHTDRPGFCYAVDKTEGGEETPFGAEPQRTEALDLPSPRASRSL